jgi:hypothetical protein
MSGEPHDLQRKHPCNHLNVRPGWPPDPVWMLWRIENFSSLPGIEPQFLCCPAFSLVTILTVLPQFSCLKYIYFPDWCMLSDFVLNIRKVFITASPSIDKSNKYSGVEIFIALKMLAQP